MEGKRSRIDADLQAVTRRLNLDIHIPVGRHRPRRGTDAQPGTPTIGAGGACPVLCTSPTIGERYYAWRGINPQQRCERQM